MSGPYQVVKDFERAVADYTGAPYVVAVSSCSAALMLAVAWHLRNKVGVGTYNNGAMGPRPAIEIPARTYLSVPMSIIHAGGRPTFRDEDWLGAYPLSPLPVWDSARWFTSGLFDLMPIAIAMSDSENPPTIRHPNSRRVGPFPGKGQMICTSHHWSKTLGVQQGGTILHDNPEADAWLRRARFDGRTEGVAPKDDNITQIGHHCYMSPEVAAEGLVRLHFLPKHNDPLPNDDYPNLAEMEIFR